jgi:hypothetical protein
MKSTLQLRPNLLQTKIDLSKPVRIILIGAFILLPFSHLRWLPELGTTRPISSILFVLAFGIICLEYILNGLGSLRLYLFNIPGWKFLRYWLILIALGIISALITPFYGNFFQAINRLLGYIIIFTTLYCTLYALQQYGITHIAIWISLGYLPALLYGFFEALVAFKIPWAITFVLAIRQHFIVDMPWSKHLSLFTTEPSFVSFQLILLIAILPFLKQRLLRWSNLIIILLAIIFSLSGHVILQVLVYLVMLGFFTLSPRFQLRLSATTSVLGGLGIVAYIFVLPIQVRIQSILVRLMQIQRFNEMTLSAAIRFSYIKNLFFTLIDTRGLGLGIGQYGQFWKEIYLRYINYKPLGIEVANALASNEYMRPWSVILGIGVDLGMVGLILILGFLYETWHSLRRASVYAAHGQAIWVSGVIALAGAYPIVTPHVWIALALLAGFACQQLVQSNTNITLLNTEK